MLTRASARASGAPGQRVDAVPERDVLARVRAVDVGTRRALEAARVAVRGAVEHHQRRAGRDVDAADRASGTRASRKSPLIGLSYRSVSSTKFGMRSRSSRSSCCRSGRSPSSWSALASRRTVVSWPGREQVRGDAHDVDDLGRRAVGERRGGEPGEHVVARLAPPILDVLGEPLVEELQRVVRHRVASVLPIAPSRRRPPSCGAEHRVIRFGHAEQIGDDEHRERARRTR